VLPFAFGAWMERVAGAIECRDREPTVDEFGEELAAGICALHHGAELNVRRGRPVAAGELQPTNAELGRRVEHRIQVQMAQAVREHTDLHAMKAPQSRLLDYLHYWHKRADHASGMNDISSMI